MVADLVRRAEQLRSGGASKGKENMLTITGEGRAAALDLRLIGADTDETVKLDVAADRIAGIWRDHRDTTYLNPDTQQPHPTPGALQLVFCDLGVPNDEGRFSVYDDLRTKLHERGLPEGSVRFMHEANNDAAKAAMFRAARSGQIAVLIGSTQRMGVGTNVQTRARALHHLDCPWRPADIAQREGRIIRQRNQNPEVEILRYVTEGSFDAYSWQTVTRKAMFIAQMMRGRLDVREIEDIGDAALSYDEVKALATGDPRVMEKAKADSDVNRLERLERAHYRNNDHLLRTVRAAERAGEEITDELRQVDDEPPLPLDAGERSRALMHDVPRFAEHHRYRAVIVENVPALLKWVHFPKWIARMRNLDYDYQVLTLNSAFAHQLGAPAPSYGTASTWCSGSGATTDRTSTAGPGRRPGARPAARSSPPCGHPRTTTGLTAPTAPSTCSGART
ncbi:MULTISPECIES: helicase-related protein [unclassified Pseudonocardia]|uniref:helicase-related protein n=1 Tax=unclassified Pseudonocardia TaxID=2619320 RepID=UPI00158C606F|nr:MULTISPECIES: helicase-related protein [unclassified Pseudonocardia]